MRSFVHIFKCIVAAFLLGVWISMPAAAQEPDIAGQAEGDAQAQQSEPPSLDDLMAQLADPETKNWEQIERQIRREWSRSGSASIDFLYQRAEKALEAKDYVRAFEHFTALTDHAPDFAEGWNGRATALFHQQKYGPALEDIGRALALRPDHFGAMTGLAVIFQNTGLHAEALEVWYLVRALHPHRAEMEEAIRALEAKVSGAEL